MTHYLPFIVPEAPTARLIGDVRLAILLLEEDRTIRHFAGEAQSLFAKIELWDLQVMLQELQAALN